MTSFHSIALSHQLQATARFVGEVRAGKSSNAALQAIAPTLHPATQAIGFAVLRSLGRAQVLLELLASKKPPVVTENLLLVALALISMPKKEAEAGGDDTPAYDPHTLVNQTVQAAKNNRDSYPQANFVNACLRRFLRDKESLLSTALAHPVARWNHPQWWIAQAQEDHPQHWQTILKANHTKAPLVLRQNSSHTSLSPQSPLAPLIIRVCEQECTARRVGEFALALPKPVPVSAIDGFEHGTYSVQDSAAQLAAPLLLRGLARHAPVKQTWRVLDACAAPGGKTTHLIEMSQTLGHPIEVTALDIDAKRCDRIAQNLSRCQQSAHVIVADAGKPKTWWDGQPFDGILLDAPCTASGIVRRHPDVAWLRRQSDIAQLAAIQRHLLDTLWPLLAPGGLLLYCTCSTFKAEGQNQVQAFLSRNTSAVLLPSPGHLLPGIDTLTTLLPDNQAALAPSMTTGIPTQDGVVCEHDGFFYALFQHQSSPDGTASS